MRTITRFILSILLTAALFTRIAEAKQTSEISVNLKLDYNSYVAGERIRGIVDVANMSPNTIDVGRPNSPDRFLIEIFRSVDQSQLTRVNKRAFVAEFTLQPNEGQKLETFLGDHYGLRTTGTYLAKPVLVHDGMRFEGQMRSFDIVPGMAAGGALQMFSNHEGLRREFSLLTWSRNGTQHLFITAQDSGPYERPWPTTDLGDFMRVTKPTISVMPTGEVIVLHRVDPDNFIRSEFWSVKDDIEFHRREIVQDPETAGTKRIREIYKDSGGVKPKEHSWWKFWQ